MEKMIYVKNIDVNEVNSYLKKAGKLSLSLLQYKALLLVAKIMAQGKVHMVLMLFLRRRMNNEIFY